MDVVVRLHQGRSADFRRGWRIGSGDHAVRWAKPQRPTWMARADYLALPGELFIREVRVRVAQPGFRTKSLVVAATITDPAVTATTRDLVGNPGWATALAPADELVDKILSRIIRAKTFHEGDRTVLLINNLGATTPMELAVVAPLFTAASSS